MIYEQLSDGTCSMDILTKIIEQQYWIPITTLTSLH